MIVKCYIFTFIFAEEKRINVEIVKIHKSVEYSNVSMDNIHLLYPPSILHYHYHHHDNHENTQISKLHSCVLFLLFAHNL